MNQQFQLTWITAPEPSIRSIRRQAATWSHRYGNREKKGSKKKINSLKALPPEVQEALERRFSRLPTTQISGLGDLPSFFVQTFKMITGDRGLEWLQSTHSCLTAETITQFTCLIAFGVYDQAKNLPVQRLARQRYLALIKHVRAETCKSDTSSISESLCSALALSFVELLVWNDPLKWMMHVGGMSKILSQCSPQAFKSGSAFLSFRLVRSFIIALDLFKRKASFISSEDWQNIPWSDGKSKTPLDLIVDVLLLFPNLLELSDLSRDDPPSQSELKTKVDEYIAALHAWQVKIIPTKHDWSSKDVIAVNSSMIQHDATFTLSIAMYLSGWLLLTRLGPKYYHKLPKPAGSIAHDILLLCQKHVADRQSDSILAWMMPIRIAKHTMDDGSEDAFIRLCLELAQQQPLRFAADIMMKLPGAHVAVDFLHTQAAKSSP